MYASLLPRLIFSLSGLLTLVAFVVLIALIALAAFIGFGCFLLFRLLFFMASFVFIVGARGAFREPSWRTSLYHDFTCYVHHRRITARI